jgi:hypothetical protein
MDNLKLYIAILDQVPSHMVPVLVAHSMLGGHIAFSGNAKYDEWLYDSFRKVTLKVNQKEFDRIAEMELVYRGHENTTLEGKKSCLVVCPREEYPNVIKFAKLWTP